MLTEPWVSVDDVAKHLGVAKDSVYRWIDAKGLPAKRVGRLWKFRLSEVDEWVNAGGAAEGGDPEVPSRSGER
jgi:excisionase family DNA binding protein